MPSLHNRAGFGLAAAALCATAMPSAAQAQSASFPCFDETAMQSARIHDLRIMLMVNALKCRANSPATLRSYGRLLDARGDELTYHGERVMADMVGRYGERQGEMAFDRYETQMSNYHSNVQPSREQCEDVNSFIKLAGRADYEEMEMLSKLVTNRAINSCLVPESNVAFSRPAPAPVAEPAPAAPSASAPKIVDGIPTYTTADAPPASAPAPLETVAMAEPEPAAPAPEPEADRLGQAITALDAAAAALRDLQSENSAAQ
ncbi:hypothetical protein [Erythrobacter sp. YT30]|uniref:hypothetical protein n=1 Tax=Erythrobacter sp. YT30 TaxID=1735012 RepID=UPI000AD8EC90|nr:hypothetical protein [Erythrobacter sp. YT30]